MPRISSEAPRKFAARKGCEHAQVVCVSASVTDAEELHTALAKKSLEVFGVENVKYDVVVSCAGFAHPTMFRDTPYDKIDGMVRTNLMGGIHVVREVLPAILAAGGNARIMLVSSQCATAAVAGYSVYSATKAGLKAFAQAMDMECAPQNVRFSVLFPPDVATRGFDEENRHKCEECRRISAMAGAPPATSQQVAEVAVDSLQDHRLFVDVGMDGWLMGILSVGMSPPSGVLRLVIELLTMGIIRVVSCFYTMQQYNIVRAVDRERKSHVAEN